MKKKSAGENDPHRAFRRAYARAAAEDLQLSEVEIVANVARAFGISAKRLARIWKPQPGQFQLGVDQANGFAAVELRLRLTMKWKRL